MDVFECIRARRSVRAYRPDAVPDEVIGRVVEAAMWAPSASNRQEVLFIVTTSQADIRRLQAFAPGIIGNPPAIVVVACDKRRIPSTAMGEEMGPEAYMDVAMGVQNMLLAATAMGLGSCVVGSFHPPSIARLLGLPDDIVPVLLVSLGYPQYVPDAPPRRPLSEVLHWGRLVYNGASPFGQVTEE